MRRIQLVSLGSFLVANFGSILTAGVCAGAEPTATLLSETFTEELREQVPVSGSPVVGATIGALPPRSFESLAILSTSELRGSEEICVTAVTQNGRYRAQNRYRLPDAQGQRIIELPFPTKYGHLLRQENFSALAILGECQSRQTATIFPIILDKDHIEGLPIVIAINGGGNRVVLKSSETPLDPQRCEKADAARPIAFDSLCFVAINADRSPIVSVSIEERRGPEVISVTTLSIAAGH